ncbi:Translation initiation factor IF-2, partial [termite gut metagenome]
MFKKVSMAIRLNKATRDLNVGITTVVEFLQKKGHAIEASPNTKITEEQYAELVKEFSKDKNLRIESERFIQERQNKERNKASALIVDAEKKASEKLKTDSVIKTTVPDEARPKFKAVGKIDLNDLNPKSKREHETKTIAEKKKLPEITEEKTIVVEKEDDIPIEKQSLEIIAPVSAIPDNTTDKKSERTIEEITTNEDLKEEKEERVVFEEKNQGNDNEEQENFEEKPDENAVFKIRPTEFVSHINVVGQIDLSTLNQNTRPKKKSKEEKRKEREDKDKARQDQKDKIKEAIIREIRKEEKPAAGKQIEKPTTATDTGVKKKRIRINKEKVNINNVSAAGFNRPNPNNEKAKSSNGGGQVKSRNNQTNNRFKKPIIRQAVNEADVAKQVKETLARLINKGKTKTSKYRKEKRETAFNRQQELESLEMEGSKTLKITEFVTANELASMMNVSVNQVIATCMSIGIMVSINQRMDAETINLVAEEFGFETEYISAEVSQAIVEEEDSPENLQPRAPIVTVMGHVDHGKTSLLDYIRKANVIAGEAGGITQHIGAYHVILEDNRRITFLDTPGHEAFTAMRARGAQVTDIAVIIVAADDHVMPQTREAINHAMAAGVPIVFAVNKIDKPSANPDKIKEELANMNFLIEEWGGKYQSQDISAKQGIGVHELMAKVLLEAEMLDLKANPNRNATGSIIESSLDKGRGYVATVLVSNGTLNMGDIVLAGTYYGRVKAMFNERNQRIQQVGPAEPVLILGLNGAPTAGDTFHVIETEQEAREITNKREQLQREQGLRTQKILTLDELGRRIALGNFRELNIIVKGDVDGSIEALSDALIKLSAEHIQVNVIHKAVGQISESDVTLAAASDAIIIGFQVRPSASARKYAEQEGVDIRMYSIIYTAIEEVKAAMEGMLAPEIKEEITATLEVREVFNITKIGIVAGAMVKEGKIKRTDRTRVIRDGIVIHTGNISA